MPITLTDELVAAILRLLTAPTAHVCKVMDKQDCPRCQAEEQAHRALKRANKEGKHE